MKPQIAGISYSYIINGKTKTGYARRSIPFEVLEKSGLVWDTKTRFVHKSKHGPTGEMSQRELDQQIAFYKGLK